MDYEQITILRSQLDDIDEILRDKQVQLRELAGTSTPGAASQPVDLTPEQAARREAIAAEIQALEVQKKELADLLTRGLAGF